MDLPFRLLVITDAAACRARARGVVETVARALGPLAAGRGAGVAVLVRDKRAAVDDVARACAALRPVTRRAGALLLVHTHARLVARLGLDGVHVDGRARVDEARIALPPGALLGASRHAGDLAPAAHRRGPGGLRGDDDGRRADYVTLSPIFRPASKPADARATLGLAGLGRACAAGGPPVVALGGVDDRSARACLDAGAAAVAVIGAVTGAHDPARALAALLTACRRALR